MPRTKKAPKSRPKTARSTGARKRSKSAKKTRPARRWSHKVDTESTFPPAGTFTKDAETIARIMARKDVSPKGPGSGIRMIQFFINRAGKNLSQARRRELEKAKKLLQERVASE